MVKVDEKSLQLLRDRVGQIEQLQSKYQKDAFDLWRTETQMTLEHIFGEKSDKVRKFKSFNGSVSFFFLDEPDYETQRRREESYYSDLKAAHNYLTGLINFLSQIVGSNAKNIKEKVQKTENSLAGEYRMHPIISSVASELYVQGFYRDAVRAAFIEVIDQVKQKGGYPTTKDGAELDGDSLMNHMFGSASTTPAIKWSNLRTRAEKDFQQGMMYLFKGMVGLRNEKGHMNVEQKDKEKAFEYLSLASLLLRELDETDG